MVSYSLLLAQSNIPINNSNNEQSKKKNTSEAEKGYTKDQIEKGWNYGEDAIIDKEEIVASASAKKKSNKDVLSLLEEILEIQKKQLAEQKRIKEILEEEFDPKPRMITKEDGTKCIMNSSADCFVFPLIAEARRVPVMANYLKNPHDQKAVSEYKKWFATYLNHNFDIGKATEYDTAENGSNSFKTDYKSDGFETSGGYFSVAKQEHNQKIINAFGKNGSLFLRVYLGKTPDLDLYAADHIAIFINKHPDLKVELLFANKESANAYKGLSEVMPLFKQAFTARNTIKRVAGTNEIPATLQATPAFEPHFKNKNINSKRIVKNGKLSSDSIDNYIMEWLIFEKIVDPSQLNDAKVWKDNGNFSKEFYKNTYGVDIKQGN